MKIPFLVNSKLEYLISFSPLQSKARIVSPASNAQQEIPIFHFLQGTPHYCLRTQRVSYVVKRISPHDAKKKYRNFHRLKHVSGDTLTSFPPQIKQLETNKIL